MDNNEAIVVTENSSVDVWDELDASIEDTSSEAVESFEDDAEATVDEKSDEAIIEDSNEESEDIIESNEEESVDEQIDTEASELSIESIQSSIDSGDLKIKHKVDGEEVEVSLQELKDNYAGKVAYDKKFSEFDKLRKSHMQDFDAIQGYINNFSQKVNDGDIVGAFQYFGEFAKVPPYMIKEQLIAALKPEIERRSILSNSELQNELLNNQNDYLKSMNESAIKRREAEQADRELQSKILNIRETHKIEADEWNKALEEVSKLEKEENLTPELIQNKVLSNRTDSRAESLLTSFDKELGSSSEWLTGLKDVMKANPDFTDEDLMGILEASAKQVGYTTTKQRLENKLKKQNASKTTTTTKKAVQQSTYDDELAEFFF